MRVRIWVYAREHVRAAGASCLVANVVDFGLQGISRRLFCAILPHQLQFVLTLLGNLQRTADVAYIRRLLMTNASVGIMVVV